MESISKYTEAAIGSAVLEELEDNEGFCATIPGFKGLIVFSESKEGAVEELRSVLPEWIDLGLKLGHGLPPVSMEGSIEPAISH